MEVVIMRGLPGSGKGYWIDGNIPDTEVVSADHYFIDPDTGEYVFDPSQLPDAHAQCLRDFISLVVVRREPVIVVDNTNTSLVEMAPYIATAMAYDYDVRIVHVECEDLELCAERNVHGVPLDAIINMDRRWESVHKFPPFWPKEEVV